MQSTNFKKEKNIFLQDDVCKNALVLTSGTLNIKDKWPIGINCQWLLSVEDDNTYIALEFEHLDVSIYLAGVLELGLCMVENINICQIFVSACIRSKFGNS